MKEIIVGVSGINAVDNPGPGIGVARSLKEDKDLDVRIVGLAYDAMEPGIYMDWLIDKSFIMPYPSAGHDAYISRLLYIKESYGLDFVLPTLDAELPLYIKYALELERNGIKTFLPTLEQFKLRSKDRLEEVAREIGMKFPKTRVVSSYQQLRDAVEEIGLPVMVKGIFYGAEKAYTVQEAIAHFNKIASQWGFPIIVQEMVSGEEVNVVGAGDGEGGHLGLFAIKKLWITSLGKIWTGVSIKNDALLEFADRFVSTYRWRGGFELECIAKDDEIYLIEINPRFPAWVYFATGSGLNIPANVLRRALEMDYEVKDYEAGRLYVRYTYELVTDMEKLHYMTTKGEA